MIVITLDDNSVILYDTTSPTHYTTNIPGIIHIKLCAHVQIFIVYDLFGVFLTVRRVSPTKKT